MSMDMEFVNAHREQIEEGFGYLYALYSRTKLTFEECFVYGVYLCPECLRMFKGSNVKVESELYGFSLDFPMEEVACMGSRISDFRCLFTPLSDPFGTAEYFCNVFSPKSGMDSFWAMLDDGVPIEDVLA